MIQQNPINTGHPDCRASAGDCDHGRGCLVLRSCKAPAFVESILAAITLLAFLENLAQAEVWITEEKVHIDRCASAWFISRFVDPEPEFVFIPQGQEPPEGNTFDFFGAKYFHHGPDCTFTTLVKTFEKQKIKALIEMNSTVNDAFGWMNAPSSFAAKFRDLIANLEAVNQDDARTVRDMAAIFDLLYFRLGGNESAMLESERSVYRENIEEIDREETKTTSNPRGEVLSQMRQLTLESTK